MRLPRAPWSYIGPILLLSACTGAGVPAAGAEASIAVRAGGWTSLFDGRTTAGWRGYRQATVPSGWTVVDGALTRTGEGGDIITVGEYGSFELELEWQVAPGGNSGVMYRVTEDDEYSYRSGPEMQVLDDAAHADGLNRLTAAGSCYGLYAAPAGVVKPAGEWNAVRIVVRGSQVEHWMNGQQVVSYELGGDISPSSGSPALGSGAAPAGFDAADYLGAVKDAASDWTRGWTEYALN